jgi:hypothetical protein
VKKATLWMDISHHQSRRPEDRYRWLGLQVAHSYFEGCPAWILSSRALDWLNATWIEIERSR